MSDPTSPEWTEAHQQASEPVFQYDPVDDVIVGPGGFACRDLPTLADELHEFSTRIASLERQLATRDAEIERLREAGSKLVKFSDDRFDELRKAKVNIDRLRADAERLDWIASHNCQVLSDTLGAWVVTTLPGKPLFHEFRAAIDAAREAESDDGSKG